MYSKSVLALIFLMSACSLGVSSDKRNWKPISCNGFKGWDYCMRDAKAACPNGFDMRKQEEDAVTLVRKMEFTCK